MTNAILHKTIIFENACLSEFYVTNRAQSTNESSPIWNESSPSWNESSPSTPDSLTFVFFSGWPINWNWEYRFAINCNCNSENAINCNCTSENAINFPGLLQILQLIVIAVNMLAPLVPVVTRVVTLSGHSDVPLICLCVPTGQLVLTGFHSLVVV